MKKLWLLLLLVLPLGGCIDDMEFNLNDLGSIFGYPEQEEGLFVFYPLFNHSSSNSPLKLHVAPRTDKDWDANQTGEIEQGFDNMHVIALYQKECPNCEKQAPYMARLADKFSQQTSLNFSVIFADVYNTDIKDREARQKNNENREEVQQRDWVQELNKSARVYTSYYRYCPDSNSFQQKMK